MIPRGCRGSVSVEVAILAPAFILLIVTATIFGRLAVAANAIDVAAHDAARAASISRTAPAAEVNALTAAHTALEQQGLQCVDGPTVEPDLSGFFVEGRELAYVEVTITCEVSFADLAFPGIPGSRVVSSSFVSAIDIYREQP